MRGPHLLLVLGYERGNWLDYTVRIRQWDKTQPNPEIQDGKATEILRDFCGLFAYITLWGSRLTAEEQYNKNAIPANEEARHLARGGFISTNNYEEVYFCEDDDAGHDGSYVWNIHSLWRW